ncbi:MAG: cytochrome c [Pseudohongiella sp.]|nr:cytochrome c [Pseudohongiella sp.]
MQRSVATFARKFSVTQKVPAVCALVLSSMLVACSGADESSAPAATEVVLPVSLNEVMVALINKAADPIWAAVWAGPQSDHDWRELEHLAYQVELGGALLKYPGTGPLDQAWTSNPDWQQLAEQLSQDGKRAVNAVRSRNMDLMERAGGQLVDTCEACHRAFKPDLPTMDMFGELPARPPVSIP